jgi:hypothetical protein
VAGPEYGEQSGDMCEKESVQKMENHTFDTESAWAQKAILMVPTSSSLEMDSRTAHGRSRPAMQTLELPIIKFTFCETILDLILRNMLSYFQFCFIKKKKKPKSKKQTCHVEVVAQW